MSKPVPLLISILLFLTVFRAGSAGGRAAGPGHAFSSVQRTGAALRLAPRQISESNKRLRYTIKVRYPQAVGAGNNPGLRKLNQELRQFIEEEVGAFKKEFSAPDEPTFGGESTFDSRYQVEFSNSGLVSIGFIINTYFEGAIHGQYNIIVFNYDLTSGRRLSLSDLFKPGSNYLGLISDYAVKSLRKKLNPDPEFDWILSGAGAEEKNYRSWNITREGLEVTFNPYQVASYAEGPQVVIIPYGALKDVIAPRGPLSRIAGRH